MCCPLLLQSLKLLGEVSEEQASCALQLAAQVNFRLDKGQACADAYDKLKAAGQVRFRVLFGRGFGGLVVRIRACSRRRHLQPPAPVCTPLFCSAMHPSFAIPGSLTALKLP